MRIYNLTIPVLFLSLLNTIVIASNNIIIDLSNTDKQFLLSSNVMSSMKSEGEEIKEDYKMTLLAIVDVTNLNSSHSSDGKSTVFSGIRVNILVYKSEEKVTNDITSLKKVKEASLSNAASFELKSYDIIISSKVKIIMFEADNISIKGWKEEADNKVNSISKYYTMQVDQFKIEEGSILTFKFKNIKPNLKLIENTHGAEIKKIMKKFLLCLNNEEECNLTQKERDNVRKLTIDMIEMKIIESSDENKEILKEIFDKYGGNGWLNKWTIGGAIVGCVAIVALGVYFTYKGSKKI